MNELEKWFRENNIRINQAVISYKNRGEEISKAVKNSLLETKNNKIKKLYLDDIRIKNNLDIDNRVIGWWLKKNNVSTIKDSTANGKKYISIDY